ncbi:MAG: FlgD immunoglobulin-like domain containing protein [Candidatus Krumholzibacteriota bacterium]
MRYPYLLLALAALCFCVGACSDDDPARPGEFAVTIKVADAAGDPVEGLRVGLVNDTSFLPDGARAAKAATSIRFQMAVSARLLFTIEDIEGREIRILVDEDLNAGTYTLMWDGVDNEGVHQPSGRYTAHMAATELDTGDLMFEDRTDMLLAMLDMSRVPAGYTDGNGKLVLKDKKLFPHLYDLPDMQATNENGEPIGLINLTPLMRISLKDEVGGGYMNFKEEIIAGTVLNVVWDPRLTTGTEFQATDIGEPDYVGPPPPEGKFELSGVYPNPFN